MNTQTIVVWSVLPVQNLEAATKFYDTVFGWTSEIDRSGPMASVILNGAYDTVGANLVEGETAPGTITHFLVPDTAAAAAQRVTEAGGRVVAPEPVQLPVGQFIVAQDPDGNMLGLFEPKAA